MDTTEAEKKSMESMETDSPRKEGVKKRPIPPADGRQNTEESFVTPQKLLEQGWIAETRGFQAANARILTARRMVALADFSAGDPLRWRTIRARFFFEELGVNDLAKMLGISRRTVSRHLQPVHKHRCINFYINKFQIPSPTLRGVAKRPLILADMTFLTRLRSSEIPPLIVLAA